MFDQNRLNLLSGSLMLALSRSSKYRRTSALPVWWNFANSFLAAWSSFSHTSASLTGSFLASAASLEGNWCPLSTLFLGGASGGLPGVALLVVGVIRVSRWSVLGRPTHATGRA